MKTSASTFLFTMAGLISFTAASVPDGYQEYQMQWTYDTPDGNEITLNGTIEEANDQYEALFPGELAKGEKPELVTRQFEKDMNITCFNADPNPHGWEMAKLDRLEQGWNHLNRVPGKPSNGPGPGNCGRVSCSHDAAIWWCNDNDKPYTLDSFQVIGVAAADICYQCTGGYILEDCGGQAKSTDNINVIVRKDDC